MAKNQILALMCGVVAMAVIDLAVVNTALPRSRPDLEAEPADLQWVVIGYGVFVAGFLLLGGRLGDLAGHRTVLVPASPCSPPPRSWAGSRRRWRCSSAPARHRGSAPRWPRRTRSRSSPAPSRKGRTPRALGIFGAAGGTAAAAIMLSGVLVQGPGWPWAYFLNVPAGLVLAALILLRVPADPPRGERAAPICAAP